MTNDWKPGILYEFQKNRSERVRCSLTEYRDRRLVDLRVFFEDDEGSWRPTPKGISVSIQLIDELVRGISKVKEALDGS